MKSSAIFLNLVILLGLMLGNSAVNAQASSATFLNQSTSLPRDLAQGSEVTFRKEAAAWLNDLILHPTRTEHFFLNIDGKKVASTNKFLDPGILCTINGRTEIPPAASSEGYTFCTISKDRIVRVNFADYFNLFQIEGESSKIIYPLLPNEYPPREFEGYLMKSRYIGRPFHAEGILCTEYTPMHSSSEAVFYRCSFTESI